MTDPLFIATYLLAALGLLNAIGAISTPHNTAANRKKANRHLQRAFLFAMLGLVFIVLWRVQQ